jgi:hypothetical protein
MKCDDFISSLETGSALSRLRARLHARRCPKCAATRNWLSQVQSRLATSAEITPFHRRVWEHAAVDNAPQPVWRWIARPQFAVAGGLTIAVVLIVTLVLSLPKNDGPGDGEVARNVPLPVTSTIKTTSLQVPAAEIKELENGLNQIALDLDRLAEEAARLEARRALSALAAVHQPLNSGDST